MAENTQSTDQPTDQATRLKDGYTVALNAATARRLAGLSSAPSLVPIEAAYFQSDGNVFMLVGKTRKALETYGREHPEHREEMKRREAEVRTRIPLLGGDNDYSNTERALLNDGAPQNYDTALMVLLEYIDPMSSDTGADEDEGGEGGLGGNDLITFEGDDDDDEDEAEIEIEPDVRDNFPGPYEARRNQWVADAAAGDPGEAEEAKYLLPRDTTTDDAEFQANKARGWDEATGREARNEWVADHSNESTDDDDAQDDPNRGPNDELIALLEDLNVWVDDTGRNPVGHLKDDARDLMDRIAAALDGLE